ncbi:enoyl-CoA hydratase [Roseococcus sp. DSY-14]|uniref:enoyl-CoA hydratase n=1 Tax=Roseococcus sp. DSY-14 TaxID=3369650 RepID=UPI00387AD4C5
MSVEVTESAGIRHVTLRNDAKLNTVNTPILEALAGAFAVGGEVRAVVLAGEGPRAFIGGADIREMGAIASPEQARAFITRIHQACAAICACPVPVVARIQGWCLGAGLEIAAACDLRLASDRAQFGMPEVRVGIPSVVEAALLPGLIGWGRTRRLLLLAETLDAATAEAWGLVERVVAHDALDQALDEWLHLLAEAGPRAIRHQKALISRWEGLGLDDAIQAGVDSFAAAFATEEPRRMLGAFLARKR